MLEDADSDEQRKKQRQRYWPGVQADRKSTLLIFGGKISRLDSQGSILLSAKSFQLARDTACLAAFVSKFKLRAFNAPANTRLISRTAADPSRRAFRNSPRAVRRSDCSGVATFEQEFESLYPPPIESGSRRFSETATSRKSTLGGPRSCGFTPMASV